MQWCAYIGMSTNTVALYRLFILPA